MVIGFCIRPHFRQRCRIAMRVLDSYRKGESIRQTGYVETAAALPRVPLKGQPALRAAQTNTARHNMIEHVFRFHGTHMYLHKQQTGTTTGRARSPMDHNLDVSGWGG